MCNTPDNGLMMGNHATRVTFLQDLTHTVVFRDVILRFELTNPTESRRLMQMALQQMGGLTSFSKLKQRMAGEGYRISTTMVSTAIAYFEDAYLIHTVEIFSMHMAVRSTNLKKFYCSDHALAIAVAEKAGPDLGAVLENIVFLHLRRGYQHVYWARTPSGKEIDFVTTEAGHPGSPSPHIQVWQVCYEMEGESSIGRETRALWEAMEVYGVRSSTIITDNTEQHLEKAGMTITIIPAWKFLLFPHPTRTPSSLLQ